MSNIYYIQYNLEQFRDFQFSILEEITWNWFVGYECQMPHLVWHAKPMHSYNFDWNIYFLPNILLGGLDSFWQGRCNCFQILLAAEFYEFSSVPRVTSVMTFIFFLRKKKWRENQANQKGISKNRRPS